MILYLICLNNNIRGGDAIMKNHKSAIFFLCIPKSHQEAFFFCTSLKVLRCDIFLKIKGLELELLIELLYGPCT